MQGASLYEDVLKAGEANKANLQLAAHEREPPLRRGRDREHELERQASHKCGLESGTGLA
ncbi:hypothetical protein HaLaN_15771 [Haematococcus lacustris]|uniref:Uncharacterized protein n=1 Tax=Haematococcus lacustris TaxID=44745 RepID=A0A699ZHG4_HAELA|nr:hypothetical protein HaLaN_15771 [Haematococcus lacustris]